jgi:hypothetical protein
MLDVVDVSAERAGGINFERQYGLRLRLGFESSNDPAAHAFVQEFLEELGEVMERYVAGESPNRDLMESKPVLFYGFHGEFLVADTDGEAKREMKFLAEGDFLGDRRVAASRYEIDLSVDFEANSDAQSRYTADAIAATMRAGLSRFAAHQLSVESLSLVGYEFSDSEPATFSSGDIPYVERPVGLRPMLEASRGGPDLGR